MQTYLCPHVRPSLTGLTWHSSPQGRIFQVEYAQEAVKQGSVVVGLVSKTHAVLAALKVATLFMLYSLATRSPQSLPPAQCGRAFLVSEESNRHRFTSWPRARRSRI